MLTHLTKHSPSIHFPPNALISATATNTRVVTRLTGQKSLDMVLRRKIHGNLVSCIHGNMYNECSSALALVGKWIRVLSLNIDLL